MIENLPNEAKTEHVTVFLIIMHHPEHAINAKTLMQTAKIHNKNTFAKVTKDLQNWGCIVKDGRYGKYHIDTSNQSGRYQYDTSNQEKRKGKYQYDTSDNQSQNNGKYHIDTSNGTKSNGNGENSNNVDNSTSCKKSTNYNQEKGAFTSVSHVHAHTPTPEEELLLFNSKEKRGLGKKETVFVESEIGKWADFQAAFSGPEYKAINLQFYYGYLKSWTDQNGKLRTSSNWLNAARSVFRLAHLNNSLKTKSA